MLDYSAIAALSAVIETQGFLHAAERLCITQSAVSQRIKSLENNYGEPVLIRTLPYRPTPFGLKLLSHYKRIILLEEELHDQLHEQTHTQRISVAISRDSLETWFVPIIEELKTIQPLTLAILADDQDVTLNHLQNGLVSSCATHIAKSLPGCKSEWIGYFDYVLVASPEFKKKYFSNKKSIQASLLEAPALIFDHKDQLHAQYLKHFFNLDGSAVQYHVVPSVAGFRQFAMNGYAYALIPAIDVELALKQHKLVNLFPDKVWQMPVYWHSWAIEARLYKLFTNMVLKIGRKILRQS